MWCLRTHGHCVAGPGFKPCSFCLQCLCCSFSLGRSNGNLCSRSVLCELVSSAFHQHAYKSVKSALSLPSSSCPRSRSSLTFPTNLVGDAFASPDTPPKPPTLKFFFPPSLLILCSWHCHLRITVFWGRLLWSKLGAVWGVERPGIWAVPPLRSVLSYHRDQNNKDETRLQKKASFWNQLYPTLFPERETAWFGGRLE